MRKFFMIFFLFVIKLFSQTFEITGEPVELFMGTKNVDPVTKSMTIHMSAVGIVWGVHRNNSTYNFYITNEFSDSYFTPDRNNEINSYNWGGYDFVTSPTGTYEYPIFAYGLYKLYTDESQSYFYIDFRDDRYGRYGNYEPPTYGHDIDIWLKYNDLSNAFSITSQPSFGFGEPLSNGQLLKIWDIKHKGQPQTNEFPDFWQNCLVSIPEEEHLSV